MYYIMNETNQIIAADESLLTLCGFTHINDLTTHIILEKLTFQTKTNNQLILTQNNQHYTFPITYTSLSSLLGTLTLITLDTDKQTSTSENLEDINIDSLLIKTDSPNNTITIIDEIQKETLVTPLEMTTPLLDDTFTLLDTKEQIAVNEETYLSTNIIIDIEKVSEEIGVSKEDFNLFLNEYIDTALGLEQDLKSSNNEIRLSAIQTLLHLSDILHLDVVDDILEKINTSSATTRTTAITSFYDALSRITTTKVDNVISHAPSKPQSIKEPSVDDDIILFDLGLSEDNTPNTEAEAEAIIENIEVPEINVKSEPKLEIKALTTSQKTTSFDDIDLSEVKPIHFDFQISAAADELSLPESLIEEFMVDFVEQAHTETDKMLHAYKKGDLESVNKIGHLLKGVSSNLRITPLSDTLYKIQFCKEPNDLEALIKDYWGHFLFFEKQINMLSN